MKGIGVLMLFPTNVIRLYYQVVEATLCERSLSLVGPFPRKLLFKR